MSLNDLSAQELAQIDAICLDYESQLRRGSAQPIEKIVGALGVKLSGGVVEVLRQELEAIHEEVQRALNPPPVVAPFQGAEPSESAQIQTSTPDEISGDVLGAFQITTPIPSMSPKDAAGPNTKDVSAAGISEASDGFDAISNAAPGPVKAKPASGSSATKSKAVWATPPKPKTEADNRNRAVTPVDKLVAGSADTGSSGPGRVHEIEAVSASEIAELARSEPTQAASDGSSRPKSSAEKRSVQGAKPPANASARKPEPKPKPVAATPNQVAASVQSPGAGATATPGIVLPKAGDRIGPYVILKEIGRGGMGIVYQAEDLRLDREVAIKVLAASGSKRQELNDRFEREAKAVAGLSHPNIIELFDVGVAGELPFAVMEFLRGETLSDRIQRGRLSSEAVRFIGAQIADALAVAHSHGVIHRDLKPQNVMVIGASTEKDQSPTSDLSRFEIEIHRKEGKKAANLVKVLDFGLSRFAREDVPNDASATKAGVIMGTPGYMSPEQARGEVATESADIFSLGCVLFELFYGKEAIPGETSADRLASTLREESDPDPEIEQQDPALAKLISDCLSRTVQQRPQTAAEIARQLRRPVVPSDPVMAQIDSGYTTGELVRRRFLAVAGGGVAGALLGAYFQDGAVNKLSQVRSLAVLSLNGSVAPNDAGKPIGDRDVTPAERLAGLLVNELGRLDSDLMVLPYRPLSAASPNDFSKLGRELGVDAFITGSAKPSTAGEQEFLDLNLQIVSADSGEVLWNRTGVTRVGDNLLEQNQLAIKIAQDIGFRLSAVGEEERVPATDAYNCLVDGKVRSDPDSVPGMKMALECLEKARAIDGRYAEPVAGIALTAVMLAAQSSGDDIGTYLQKSREAMVDALKMAPRSVDAMLASAITEWQVFQRYSKAEEIFDELVNMHRYNWRVKHQHGLLALSTGQPERAIASLRDAARLNPMSMLVKIDGFRAEWFGQNDDRALFNATRKSWKSHPFAQGLAIDIHEHNQRWQEAANVDPDFGLPGLVRESTYKTQRAKRLREMPYGPFGDELNQAIYDARFNQIDEDAFALIAEPPAPPLLPLLLSSHPALVDARKLPIVREMRLLFEDEVVL